MLSKQTNEIYEILMVDDREDGLIALEAVLADEPNYRLVKASSGLEAIELLDEHDFSVILLDVQMPEMDGFQTAAYIRRTPRHAHIPIVFVTAIDKDERYVYRGYQAGAVDYIFKPFDPIILKCKVAVFVELHNKNRRLKEQARALAERESAERKAQIQLLELESLRRYRNLAEAIPHIVLRAKPDGDLEYHNQLWTEYTGMSSQESLGMGWQNAIAAEELPRVLGIWYQAMRDRSRYEAECRIRRHDGIYRWHWIKADPELDDEGAIIAWLGTCTDIHERKIVEEKLKETQQKAEAANSAKTQFLANMSHEIRTPLNAIMGFTELLIDPAISAEEKHRSVAIVRRNGHQLLKIVDEILDISKVESGGLVIEHVEMPMENMLSEVKALMSVQADKRGVSLNFELASKIPATVLSDSTRIRQILINIIGNAIKFTHEGDVGMRTSFVQQPDGKAYMRFEITDTGIGVPSASAERIFQPFSQADTSTTRIYGGTGLGLPLSRRLARAMGGDVRLMRSEPGSGSVFVVTVQVEVPHHSEWITRSTEEPELTEDEIAISEGPLNGKRILLVEDAEDNQFLITQFLSRTGAIVDIASNGEEGVRKALSARYEVVLMDIQMPLIDGYEATSQLRSAGYDRPIIALTAHALNEERDRCLNIGCSGHLTKPISRRQLIESLVHHVGP